MSKTAKEGVSLTKFGEILMQLRQEKHLSQAELGHIIYVSGGTISNYEKGVHYPDVESWSGWQTTLTFLSIIFWDDLPRSSRPMCLRRQFRMTQLLVMSFSPFNACLLPESVQPARWLQIWR